MRRDEERERSLISFDGEDNNKTKKRDTFFFAIRKYAQRDYYTPRMGRDLPLSFSLSLSINMLYGLLCVFG